MKYILILISFLVLEAQALTLDIKRTVAQDANLSAEKELLVRIATCSKGEKVEAMLECVKPLVSASLTEDQIRKVLFWFRLDIKVTELKVCSDSKTEFIPQRVKLDSTKIICGSYALEGLNKEALFFIGSDSSNRLKLINLRP